MKKISLMRYTMLAEKNLTPLYVREKISNYRGLKKKFLAETKPSIPPPPQKSNRQLHRGWGRSRRIWHLNRCHLSTKWLARVHHVVALKAKVLHFKIEKCANKRQVERESSKGCSVSFLRTNVSFSLWDCLSRNSTLFSSRRIRAFGLFWTSRGSEVSEETWGTFCTLWS